MGIWWQVDYPVLNSAENIYNRSGVAWSNIAPNNLLGPQVGCMEVIKMHIM